jgi:hypothetical protein
MTSQHIIIHNCVRAVFMAFFRDSTMSNFGCENGAHLCAEKGNSSLE